MIPLYRPSLGGREWEYVKECLDTGWVSSVGGYVDRFEDAVRGWAGVEHAVATTNGTAALHIALRAVGVGQGDAVLMSALSFIAPANAVHYLGAEPIAIDADPQTWQLDPLELERVLGRARRRDGALFHEDTGRRISAIMPVHILGHPVDMAPLIELADEYGLPVVEDASEALGARCRFNGQWRPVGSVGHVGCYSFNGNKLITAGGGGMVVTANAGWAAKMRYWTTQARGDPVEYVHDDVGYNYRLTNVHAAIGAAQMEQLESHIVRKREIARVYEEALAGVPGIATMPACPEWAEPTYWLYTITVDPKVLGMDRRQVLAALSKRAIQARPLWRPIHLNRPYAHIAVHCPVSEAIHDRALSIPCFVDLCREDQDRVIRELLRLTGCRQPGSTR